MTALLSSMLPAEELVQRLCANAVDRRRSDIRRLVLAVLVPELRMSADGDVGRRALLDRVRKTSGSTDHTVANLALSIWDGDCATADEVRRAIVNLVPLTQMLLSVSSGKAKELVLAAAEASGL